MRLRFAEMLEDGRLAARGEPPVGAAAGDVRPARRRPRGLRAALHVPRLPLRRGARASPRRRRSSAGSCTRTRRPAGQFECSSDLVNQLWRNVTWGQRGNFLSVPTDCPQRDERLGWLADAQVFLPSAALNMDVAAFITKWGDDILDAQSPDGAYPDVAPRLGAERDGAPAWGDAGVIVPWTIYQRYGDVRILERHWDAMERYLAYLDPPQPGPAVALAPPQRLRRLAVRRRGHAARGARDRLPGLRREAHGAHRAACWGERTAQARYEELHRDVVAAFNRAYVGEDGFIEGDTQTVYLLALHMDLRPGRAARARGGAPGRRHRAHATGTSRPASSASACSARC